MVYTEKQPGMSKLVVFGNSNYNTLGVVRGMCGKGVEVFLLLVSTSCFNAVTLSKGVKRHKRVDDEEQGVTFLLDKKEVWRDAVILPTSDKAESALDTHFDQLRLYYRFPHAGQQGAVGRLMGKRLQVEMAADSGLHVPATVRYRKGDPLPEGIVYPCIAKPQNSTTGQKEIMCACRNATELKQAVETPHHADDFLVQQYIDKEYEVLLIGCRLPDGRTWLPGAFKKERWYLKGGDASYGVISTQVDKFFPQQAEVCAFLERLGYYGPFSVEFGMMGGVLYFYEINLRNDGTSHYFHKAGIYVPYIYYLANMGTLEDAELTVPPSRNHTFIDEFGDLANMRKTKLSFRRWWYDLRHASSYKYFQAGDLKPFLAMAPRRIAASFYRLIKSN